MIFSISLLKTRLPLMLFLAAQALYSAAYAEAPAASEHPWKAFRTPYNHLDTLAYDEIVARVPPDYAPIDSVALANLNIALHNAKRQAEITLCNGQWTPNGSIVFQQGPVMQRNAPNTNAISSWHYNVLRHPQALTCGATSRATYFLEVSRHLPDWVRIRPAGQLTAFRQGETVPPEQETVAAK